MANVHTPFSFCGTKYKLIDWLKDNIKFNKNENIWVEPFCGSCVVGFNIQPKVAIFADSNPHLINFYNFLKNEKDSIREIEYSLIKHRQNMKFDEKDYYNHIRDRFNNAVEYNVFDFFFLAQTGFSHQLRYNREGKLNMAYGKFNSICDEKNTVIKRLEILKDLFDKNYYQFVLQPFEKTITDFNDSKNVFFYFDPPYVGAKQDYFDDAFNLEDRNKLLELVDNSGCNFAMSEHCKSGEEEKIREQFGKYNVNFKESMFTVNSDKITRTNEILIMNY